MQLPEIFKIERFWKKILFYVLIWIVGFELKFLYQFEFLSDSGILTYTFGFWLFGSLTIVPVGVIMFMMSDKMKLNIDDDLLMWYSSLCTALCLFTLKLILYLPEYSK